MLSLLLRARDEETGQRPTSHQVPSGLPTPAVAGTETTASVLSPAPYELARRPDAGDRAPGELDEALGGRAVTFGALSRLPFLNRVVTETRLGRWTLPPGAGLASCRHALPRAPELFPDPSAFVPDRWPDSGPPPGFLPFGAGRRKCSGDRFALTEPVAALVTILRRIRLALSPGQVVEPVARATVRPRRPAMTVRPRNGRPRRGRHRTGGPAAAPPGGVGA